MPILDARTLDASQTVFETDVCIVGAGAAGAYLGKRLASMGLRVTIVEAGGRSCSDGPQVGIEADFSDEIYSGVTDGRKFGLGGSTSSWGGCLVAHMDYDVRSPEDDLDDPWRHIVTTVQQESDEVLRQLDLSVKMHRQPPLRRFLKKRFNAFDPRGLEVMMGEMLPFRHKNMAGLLQPFEKSQDRLMILLNAVAVEWQAAKDGNGTTRVKSLTVRAGQKRIQVSAGSFVLAAGAIESARILLEMERHANSPLFRSGAAIGCYLGDHLSCTIAEIPKDNLALATRLFAPRFVRGNVRNFRFIDHTAPPDAPRCFAHFIFENEEDPGFQLAKKLLEGLQARVWPKLSFGEVASGAFGIAAIGWDRVARSRLHMHSGTPVHMQLDVEQHRTKENCIRLGDKIDAVGRPMPIVQWGIREEDYQTIQTMAARLLGMWPGTAIGLPNLIPVKTPSADRNKPHDAYHPVGTCSMGTDSEAVVDWDLRVHDTANLFVLSTGVFPTVGSANPTFSMLCFGEAMAKCLGKNHQRS